MCGLSGFVSFKHSYDDLVIATDLISHRGRDASGFYFDEEAGVGLGHKRLSIIDLSD